MVALVAAVLVVLTSPLVGQVRAVLQSTFPRAYVSILGGIVALSLGGTTVVALVRIRSHRVPRIAALAAALAIGALYAALTAVDQAAINAVERLHFLEYGGLTWLFFRVWRGCGNPSSLLLPLLGALLVGALDEWVQWFVPVRVGEARDVALNLVAICCGLLFALAVTPPRMWSWQLDARSWRRVGIAGAGALAVFAAFVDTVHLGHRVSTEGIGSFRSHYTADALVALSHARETSWRSNPPVLLRRYSREDQYMDEGLWHVQRRNGLWAANAFGRARHENLILERFFAPVLDTATYALPTGARWPAEQRAFADTYEGQLTEPFESDAEPYPLLTWPRPMFWAAALLAVALVAWSTQQLARQAS